MNTNCLTDTLAADIINNCDNLAKAGIEADVLIIPHKDIDWAASTFDATNRLVITDLQLIAGGKTGFLLEGVKQMNAFNWEFVKGDPQTIDKFRHLFNGVINSPTAENRLSASQLAKGESYVIVINKKYKGVGSKDAFLVLGRDAGLYVSEMTESSRDNNGAILFTLASEDGQLEADMPRQLLETDYATTLTGFENKFLSI